MPLDEVVDPTDDPEEKDSSDKDPTSTGKSVDIKEVVSAFREALAEGRKAQESAPAPGPKPEEVQAQLAQDYADTLKKYNDLCASGDFAGGANLLMEFSARMSKRTATDPAKDPAFKALVATAKRGARADHPEVFQDWASEVESEVESMSPSERINPDMWEEAVRRIKARHADEIVQRRVEEALKDLDKGRGDTFTAPGSRGRSNRPAADLDEDQLAAAQLMGMSPEDYAKAAKETEAARIRKGFTRGMVNLLPEGKPAPGRF